MEKTFETPGGADLVVHNQVGLVVVTARDMATTAVSLEADTPVGEALVERATVECKKAGDRHVVAVKLPHHHGLRMLRRNAVTVRVEVPEGGQVTVATASADIEINGSVGEVDVKTASGDASVDDVAADVKATTASGSITMGTVGGDIKAQTAVGRPALLERGGLDPVLHRLGRPGGRGGREPGGGQGDLRQRAAGRGRRGAKVANVSGNVRVLTLSEGALHVRSVSGDVAVGVAKGVDLHVDIETASGIVHSEIALHEAPASGRRPETRVDLSVRSVSGNVEIGRALEHVG